MAAKSDWRIHLRQLQKLTQLAVDVELFTIPLYMTTLYSLQGTYPNPVGGQAVWPGRRPDPNSTEPNQLAFNVIFSVYVQEMFHLQLASNLAGLVGASFPSKSPASSPRFNAPVYDGSSKIPGVVDLANTKEYKDVKVRLGPLDENQIRLFMAIETPDWDTNIPQPTVPFTNGFPKEFGTIGHLYACIKEYLDLPLDDGGTLWDKIWEKFRDSGAIQVDAFSFGATPSHVDKYDVVWGTKEEYPNMEVIFDRNDTSENARKIADLMIHAIVEEGEGQDIKNDTVDPDFVPSLADESDQDDAQVRMQFDQYSHFERFKQVHQWLQGGEIVTWPEWWARRGGFDAQPWTWRDLVMAPDLLAQDKASKDARALRKAAEQRAEALNGGASTRVALNQALNESYASMLSTLETLWSHGGSFPLPAMQALYARVASIWAAGAQPEFQAVKIDPSTDLHACQGLGPDAHGGDTCATAVIHTCSTTNSCKNQGGCGYPNTKQGNPGIPNVNSCKGMGGCGAPIPTAQIMHSGSQKPYLGVSYKEGDNVWDVAWQVYSKQNKGAVKPKKPSAVRVILPPT